MSGIKIYAPNELIDEEMRDGAKVERLVEFVVSEKKDGRKCLEMVSVEGIPITKDMLDKSKDKDEKDGESEESPAQSMQAYIDNALPT